MEQIFQTASFSAGKIFLLNWNPHLGRGEYDKEEEALGSALG